MNPDLAQTYGVLALTSTLLAYVSRKCLVSRSSFNLICLASCLLLVAKSSITIVYYYVFWLPAWTRYFLIYGMRGISLVLLYHLYERRLFVFFLQGAGIFRVTMWILLSMHLASTVAVVTALACGASNTPTGGYTTSGTPGFATKLVTFLMDVVMSLVLFFGTAVSLSRLLAHTRAAVAAIAATSPSGASGVHHSTSSPAAQRATLYRVLVYSDATRLLFVLAIDVYLMITSTDPSGRAGALPAGNVGFSGLIDNFRSVILVLNLYAPSGIAALVDQARDDGVADEVGDDFDEEKNRWSSTPSSFLMEKSAAARGSLGPIAAPNMLAPSRFVRSTTTRESSNLDGSGLEASTGAI
ncbi:hypothetical protein HK405_005199 [Cladochytrium tenue]|nr:hypothetical protein HK405_005199 [Cladochytrium tenue]